MRNLYIHNSLISENESMIQERISQGFHWLSCTRREFELHLNDIQAMLDKLYQIQLLDLHVTDMADSSTKCNFE